MEHTLVILKPDGVKKNLLMEVIERFQKEGLIVSNLKKMKLNKELLREHYSHLVERTFYKDLEEFMLSDYVNVMIVSGDNAIERVRKIVGATDPKKAEPNTIRGMYGDKDDMARNVIHASDSIINALNEIKRFYKEELEKGNNFINKENLCYQKRRENEKFKNYIV